MRTKDQHDRLRIVGNVTVHDHEVGFDGLDNVAVLVAVRHPDDEDGVGLEILRVPLKHRVDLSMRHVVNRISEQDHVELSIGHVAEDVRLPIAIPGCSTVLHGPLFCLGDRHAGDVNADIVVIPSGVELVSGTARAASEIENASLARISLEIPIDAVIGRPIETVPTSLRELYVPQPLLDAPGAVRLQQGAQSAPRFCRRGLLDGSQRTPAAEDFEKDARGIISRTSADT